MELKRSRVWVFAFALGLGAATGCKSEAPPNAERAAPKAAVSVQAAPTPKVSESDAQAVLDHWLRAQNAGDFAAYSGLYAERFQGVKRVGARAQRFDRKGWLDDRGAMFERPMKVEVSDISITATCCMAKVRFTQKWSAATFQDQGTKELILVPGGTGLQISGEEMLQSNVARAGKPADLEAKDIRLVVHAKKSERFPTRGDHSYVVLGTAGNEVEGYGRIALDGGWGVVTTRRLVNTEALAPEIKNAKGLAVRLYGGAGVVCSAKLGEIFVLRRVTPHFGTVQRWTGNFLDAPGQQAAPLPIEEVTQAAWDEASSGGVFAAEITQAQGECGSALWAREADRPLPDVFGSEPAAPEIQARLQTALRALPSYAKIATAFAKENPAKKNEPWELHEGSKPDYLVWKSQDRTLASVMIRVGAGCGDFTANLWLLYEVRGEQLRLLNNPEAHHEPNLLVLESIVDANQDGVPEIMGGEWQNTRGEANALLRASSTGYEVVRSNYPPFHDCGC